MGPAWRKSGMVMDDNYVATVKKAVLFIFECQKFPIVYYVNNFFTEKDELIVEDICGHTRALYTE